MTSTRDSTPNEHPQRDINDDKHEHVQAPVLNDDDQSDGRRVIPCEEWMSPEEFYKLIESV